MKLRFVDLGFTEEVQPSSLCQLPKEFVDIPFQVSFGSIQSNSTTVRPSGRVTLYFYHLASYSFGIIQLVIQKSLY